MKDFEVYFETEDNCSGIMSLNFDYFNQTSQSSNRLYQVSFSWTDLRSFLAKVKHGALGMNF